MHYEDHLIIIFILIILKNINGNHIIQVIASKRSKSLEIGEQNSSLGELK